MTWTDLKRHIKYIDSIGNSSFEVAGIDLDSRQIKADYVFIAVRGLKSDGHDFISQAIESGAKAVVCEQYPGNIASGIEYIKVADTSISVGLVASAFYDFPSTKLKLVGVTGTNGKTTTATMLYRLIESFGYKAGLLSTVRNYIHDRVLDASHTTPDAVRVNQLLADMVAAGCEYAFMEVSSHAMKQNRVQGLRFIGGIFTNLTHDHLDYHLTFDDYLKSKKKFFDQLMPGAFAITNADDRNGKIMVQNTEANVKTYGLRMMADFKCRIKANTLQGLILDINGVEVHSRLVGNFNAYNFTAVYGAAIELGFGIHETLEKLSQILPVDGRFDTLYNAGKKVLGIVDYAHTPDALENVLDTIKELKNNGRVITVVGCGGDRDKTKRPVMARIAVSKSDIVILTSDNPRSEDPIEILNDMVAGLDEKDHKHAYKQADRKEAIRMAARLADRSGDIILVAGKGHENYQEIKGTKFPFDDKIILKEVLI